MKYSHFSSEKMSSINEQNNPFEEISRKANQELLQ